MFTLKPLSKAVSMSVVVSATLGLGIHAATAEAEQTMVKPKLYPDGTWLSLKGGTVVEQNPDSLILDYGKSTIRVEMDDWDSNHEGELVFLGDEVTVHGKIDNDFYHKRTIEAESLYVDDLNLAIYAPSATDEEDLYRYYYLNTPIDYDLILRGKVTSIDERELTLDYGERTLTVDTSLMTYNPIDDKGFQQIDKGDYVHVSGFLDLDLVEERELMAEHIVTIM